LFLLTGTLYRGPKSDNHRHDLGEILISPRFGNRHVPPFKGTAQSGPHSGKYGKFTAAVFGWCPTLNRFAIYALKPRLTSSTFEMQIEETLPKDNLSVVSFGTGAARLIQQIDNIRQQAISAASLSTPKSWFILQVEITKKAGSCVDGIGILTAK
jgi:hypothetical protein